MIKCFSAHLKYFKYLLRHKYYVFIECCKLGIPFLGLIHDWSKFRLSEWSPYVWSFYGPWQYKDRPQWLINAFDYAWLYHQHRNKHHWQYWLLVQDEDGDKAIIMPEKYMREMLADWRGASRAITGKDNTREWYLQRQDRMHKVLHHYVWRWIERELWVGHL